MRAIPVTSPRRRPRQARAQATVEAIVKATARVLIEEGYDRASTNRIAQAAGVSIGSLYQYFPSKEALVAALVEEHLSKMTRVLSQALEGAKSPSLPDNASVMVAGLVSAYRVDPRLHHVLCQEVPKIGELRKIYEFEERLATLARSYLRGLQHTIRHTDLDRAIFLLVHAIPSVIRAAVDADPEGNDDDRLVDDVTDMILCYLMVDPPAHRSTNGQTAPMASAVAATV